MHKLEHALNLIGRRLIGGFSTNKAKASESKYMPHQGKKEIARRLNKEMKNAK